MSITTALAMAVASSCLYFLGFLLFKKAAPTLPPLRGVRPLHFAVSVMTSWPWLIGALVTGSGVVLQFAALTRLSLPVMITVLLCGLGVVMFLAAPASGEHATAAELRCLTLLAAAGIMIAWSGPGAPPPVPLPTLALLAAASLLLPVALFSFGDTHPEGQHARPLTGLSYGISAGVLIGFGELALGLQIDAGITAAALAGPLPWLFLLAAACGIAQLQIALQRCRMTVVVFVATAVAKTYLVIVGGLLCLDSTAPPFTSPWLLPPGMALIAAALVLTPRHERRRTGRSAPRG